MYSTENTIIYTLPIQNKYPDFNRIIPQSSVVFAKVNKAELQDSVARVKTIAKRDDNEQIKLTFNSEGISISCVSSTFTQSAEEKVQCEVNGEITIGKRSLHGTVLESHSK
jgi:DNA polymerase III sliding clamp (beta) subunit (PCNA family)